MAPGPPPQALAQGPSSAPSDALQQAVAEFQATLTEQQRQDFGRIKKEKNADSVLTFTASLDSINRNRKGHSISSRLYRVLQMVQDFSTVVDVFVSSNPDTAALVWGSVKFTILVAINISSFFEALSEFFLGLNHILPRFSEYHALYPGSRRLQKSLCDLHASIVRCCKHVVEASRRSWPKKFMRGVFQSFEQEFKADKADIQVRCSEVTAEIQLAKARADLQDQELQVAERETASQYRRSLNAFLGRADAKLDNVTTQQLQREERRSRQRKQKVLDKLSSHDHLAPLREGRRTRHPDTAEWLTKTPEFAQWMRKGGDDFLWLSGKIGAGKTILTTAVIDHLLLKSQNKNAFVAFFFCRFDDKASLSCETLSRCLLRQTLDISNFDDDLEKAVVSIGDRLTTRTESDDFWVDQRILNRARQFEEFYIVVDGVDECELLERRRILRALHRLAIDSISTKVFLASRERLEDDLKKEVKNYSRVPISNISMQSDIAAYINNTISIKVDSEELVVGDECLVEEIREVLCQQADGMFLWVVLQVEELCYQRSDEDIRQALHNLPKGLTETFERIVNRIIANRNVKVVQQLLPWLLAARSPLTLDQLEEIAGVEIEQPYAMKERYINAIGSITSWFENLVHLDEESGSVRFIHSTVRQFFLSQDCLPEHQGFHKRFDYINHYLGEICLTYLHFNDFRTGLVKATKPSTQFQPLHMARTALGSQAQMWSWLMPEPSALGASIETSTSTSQAADRYLQTLAGNVKSNNHLHHPFLSYAATNWLYHTTDFLRNASRTYSSFEDIVITLHVAPQVIRPWQDIKGDSDVFTRICPLILDLQHVALLGIVRRLRGLQDKAAFDRRIVTMAVERRNPHCVRWICHHVPPLFREDYVTILKVVLDYKGPIRTTLIQFFMEDRSNSHLQSPGSLLFPAVEAGEVSVVEELIRRGADPGATDDSDKLPLHIACINCDFPMVQLLISMGSPLDAVDGVGHTPLSLVVNSKQGRYLTEELPDDFMVASHIEGTESPPPPSDDLESTRQIISTLIDSDTSLTTGVELLRAIRDRNFRLANALIYPGANVEARDHVGETCLIYAAQQNPGREPRILEKLLTLKPRKVDDWGGEPPRTALMHAVTNLYIRLDTIHRLLEAGADPDAMNSCGETAISLVNKEIGETNKRGERECWRERLRLLESYRQSK